MAEPTEETLRGPRIVLASVGVEAAEALEPTYNGDPRFGAWSGAPAALTLDQIQQVIAGGVAAPGGRVWRIAHPADGVVGVAQTALPPPPDMAWIALLLIRRAFQGRGYGAEAATLLEEYLIAQPGVARIGLAVLTVNAPALAFWERRGYRREGLPHQDAQGHQVCRFIRPLSVAIDIPPSPDQGRKP